MCKMLIGILITWSAISVGMDSTLKKVDLQKTIQYGKPIMQVAISDSGRFMLANSMYKETLVYNLENNSLLQTIPDKKEGLCNVQFNPNYDSFIKISKNKITGYTISENLKRLKELSIEKDFSFSYKDILTKIFISKSTRMVAAILYKGTHFQTDIFDMRKEFGAKPISLQSNADFAQFNYSDTLLLLADGFELKIVDVKTGKCHRLSRNDLIARVCFAPTKNLLAVAESEYTVKVYDVDNNYTYPLSFTFDRKVYQICFSPDSTLLAVGLSQCSDLQGRIMIYDLNSKECIADIANGGRVNSITFDSTGKKIITASSDGNIRIFSFN